MQPITNANFGPLVAYLVPGATVLFGFSRFSPTLHSWFAGSASGAPTIGGFLYLTVASLAAGMAVSAVRWALVDTVHRWTGLPLPELDFSKLGPNVEAFALLIEIHYQHYLYYGNALIATAITYLCYRLPGGGMPRGWPDVGFLVLETIFFAASRSTLARYYSRSRQLLSPPRRA